MIFLFQFILIGSLDNVTVVGTGILFVLEIDRLYGYCIQVFSLSLFHYNLNEFVDIKIFMDHIDTGTHRPYRLYQYRDSYRHDSPGRLYAYCNEGVRASLWIM